MYMVAMKTADLAALRHSLDQLHADTIRMHTPLRAITYCSTPSCSDRSGFRSGFSALSLVMPTENCPLRGSVARALRTEGLSLITRNQLRSWHLVSRQHRLSFEYK